MGILPLKRAFFARDARRVARDLLGKVLIREANSGRLTARIVEVEAYLGEKDAAAHAASGRTDRNAVIFGPPGHAYVYFIYGNHYCLNVSCEPEGKAGCVLFRALQPLEGLDDMARARRIALSEPALNGLALQRAKNRLKISSGPGRLAQAFGITRERDNGRDLTSPASGLWIGDDRFRARSVTVSERIGITKAVDRPLRYFLTGNPFVSRTKSKSSIRD